MWRRWATRSYRAIGAGALGALDQAREQPERHRLGPTSHLVHRPDAGRTPAPAGAVLDRLEPPSKQVGQHLKDAFREANPAGLVVVEVDRRRELPRFPEARPRGFASEHDARLRGRSVAQPGPDVADVAEEEERC